MHNGTEPSLFESTFYSESQPVSMINYWCLYFLPIFQNTWFCVYIVYVSS